MDARFFGAARPQFAAAVALVVALVAARTHAAGYRTPNFVVSAHTPELAKEIGDAAEQWRGKLAQEWLGAALPRWAQPCPITAQVAPNLGAGGATSFVFDNGDVFGWRMNIQGSRERILDSVLPHEITHTIFATHFRQPLPRWADEGACTTVEHHSEIAKQEQMLISFLKSRPGRGIPFNDMFAMKEYPADVLPLYAQGHSLSVFLIGQRGKHAFLEFLGDGMAHGHWGRAVREHYGYDHLLALQNAWLDWVKSGRPALTPPDDALLASNSRPAAPQTPDIEAKVRVGSAPIDRGQSPSGTSKSARASVPATAPEHITAATADVSDWTTRPARRAMSAAPDQGLRVAGGPAYQ